MVEMRRTRSWLFPALVLMAAAALIGLVLAVGNGDDEDAADRATPVDSAAPFPYDIGIERRDPNDRLAFGPVDAPVTMVVFSDYQCPYCAKWSQDALPALLERVGKGQLRIEMRDLSVFGADSRRAAQAAYAAAIQGRYLDFHNALFDGGDKPAKGALTEQALIDTAARLGLDRKRFANDLNSEETNAAVDASSDDADTVGAYSTPSFILGGEPIAGAGPAQLYLDKLDARLTPAEK